jgi:uncharacterized membrane protein YuzA (DUF378 family)
VKEKAMELLERYLEAVRKYLPWERQDDIIAELRANLEAQLEEKEAGLGRPLTQGEMEDWLKTLGQPILVAAAYQPQRYLIGPGFFPIYWYVLKLSLGWAAVIYSIVTVVTLFAQTTPSTTEWVGAIVRIPWVLMITAAWVTAIFAVVEYGVSRNVFDLKGFDFKGLALPPSNWAPGTLPPIASKGMDGKRPPSYAKAVAELVFGILFLGWLLMVPNYPWLWLGPGAWILKSTPYELSPALWQFYWCAVALNVFQLGWKIVDLLRGTWGSSSLLRHIAFSLVGLVPLGALLSVPNHMFILLRHPELDQAKLGANLDTTNAGIYKALLLVCAIVVAKLVWEIVRRSMEGYKARVAAR